MGWRERELRKEKARENVTWGSIERKRKKGNEGEGEVVEEKRDEDNDKEEKGGI